jgi:hypothetical protein
MRQAISLLLFLSLLWLSHATLLRPTRFPVGVVAKASNDRDILIEKNKFDRKKFQVNAVAMLKRVPNSVVNSVIDGIIAFLQTAVIIVPLGLLLKIGMIRNSKQWIVEGSKMGIEWGTFSALFTSGEVFCAGIRGVEDRWNTYVGSGLCSCFTRAAEGPFAMAQGFIGGMALMYVLDQLLPQLQQPPLESQLAARNAASAARRSRGVASIPSKTRGRRF